MNPEPIHIISLGAGVQSSTVALMAAAGELKPMPQYAVFADTGDEPAVVYRWLTELKSKLPFEVVRCFNKMGRLSDNLIAYDHSQIPAFNADGKLGRRQCTSKWKVIPIIKAIRRLVPKGASVVQWIGISVDEISRAKDSREPWIVNRFPLIEKRMSRRDCQDWLQARGIFNVPKSACTYCPFHSDAQWRELKAANGKEWAQVKKVDRLLNTRGEYLHKSCKPIDHVDFSTEEERGQLNMFNNECEGMCGV